MDADEMRMRALTLESGVNHPFRPGATRRVAACTRLQSRPDTGVARGIIWKRLRGTRGLKQTGLLAGIDIRKWDEVYRPAAMTCLQFSRTEEFNRRTPFLANRLTRPQSAYTADAGQTRSGWHRQR
jgi:hypothetical protein